MKGFLIEEGKKQDEGIKDEIKRINALMTKKKEIKVTILFFFF